MKRFRARAFFAAFLTAVGWASAQSVVVNAGADDTLSYSATPGKILNGSVDADDTDYTLAWSGTSGVEFDSPSEAITDVTFPGPGVYVLTLTATATEADEILDEDDVTVAVSPFATQPANVSVTAGQAVQFTVALGGDAEPTLQWQWATAASGPWTNYAAQTATTLTIATTTVGMNGRYVRAVATFGSADSVPSATAQLTVAPAPVGPSIVTPPQSLTVSEGDAAAFSVVASGDAPLSYQWSRRNGAAGTWTTVGANSATYTLSATAAADDDAQFRVTVTNSVDDVTSEIATLTVESLEVAPTITTQPASASKSVGQSVTFTAAASGTPTPTWEWQRRPSGGDWADIPDATSASYSKTVVAGDDGAQFRAVATNSAGSAESDPATLTVTIPPSITTQPQSVSVMAPAPAVFSVTATGTAPLTYQWQVLAGGVGTWSNLSGQTGASLTLDPTSTGMSNNQYRVVVTNGAGSETSTAATLKVEAAVVTPAITTHPLPQSITLGAVATFTAQATGSPAPSLQWQRAAPGSQTFSNISGATGATYTFTPTLADSSASYRMAASNSGGSATSNAALLTVSSPNVPPSITQDPVNATVTEPSPATFSAAVAGTPPLITQWQMRPNAGTWADVSGATGLSLTINSTDVNMSGRDYRLRVSNGDGESATSAPARLTVNPGNNAPSITLDPKDSTVTAPGPVSFTVAVSGSPKPVLTWQRRKGNAAWATIAGATDVTHAIAATDSGLNGTQFRAIASNDTKGADTSATATLSVRYAPAIRTQPQNATRREGETAQFSVVAVGNPAPTYQWYRNDSALTGSTQAVFTTPPLTIDKNGAVYHVVLSNGIGAEVVSAKAELTVLPRPAIITAQPAPASVLDGQTASFSVVASGTGSLAYQWYRNGTAVTGGSGGKTAQYTTPANTLANDGDLFHCVVSNAAGDTASTQAELTVSPIPPIITNTNLTVQATQGSPFNYTVNATGSQPITFGATGLPAGLNFNSATGILSGSPQATGTFTITLSATNAGGSAPTKRLNLSVGGAPVAPTINSPLSASARVGAPFSYTITASGTAPITFTASGLPSGLSFSASTATISGTPGAAAEGNKDVNLTATNAQGSDAKVLRIGVQPPYAAPAFTQNLPATLTVNENQNVTLTVTATGNPSPNYQWSYRPNVNVNWTNIGLNQPTYSLNPARPSANGLYQVFISSAAGSAFSTPLNLTVIPAPVPPTITSQPASRTLQVGQSVTFSVTATGTPPLAYQWQYNQQNISGATSPNYTIVNAQLGQSGSYRCVVTNPATVPGNPATFAVSSPANLQVTLPKIDRPKITPASQGFYDSILVWMYTDTAQTRIYYTLDGSEPTEGSLAFAGTGPLNFKATVVLRARAYRAGYQPSDIAHESYNLTERGTVAQPTISPGATSFTGSVNVQLTTSTEGATIHYTLDGTPPNTSSPAYTGTPVTLFGTTTVRAIAVKADLLNSSEAAKTYTLFVPPPQVAPPVATPETRRFRPPFTVRLSSATDSTTIYYTLDDSSPLNPASRQTYTSAGIPLTETTILKAIATRTGYVDSDSLVTTFFRAPGPLTSIPASDQSFTGSLEVTLQVPGDFPIWYTLDASSPLTADNQSSPTAIRYTGPITLFEGTTLLAVALDGDIPSDLLRRTFTLFGAKFPPPTAQPAARNFTAPLLVSLLTQDDTSETAKPVIHYTLDGTDPNLASPVFDSTPLLIDTTTLLKAFVRADGFEPSPILSQSYVLVPDTPWADPRGTSYVGTQKVVLRSASPKIKLLYTVDGRPPVEGTGIPFVSGDSIEISNTTTLKFLALSPPLSSPTVEETYYIKEEVRRILPPGGVDEHIAGIVLQHLGESSVPVEVGYVNPSKIMPQGFSNIQFAMELKASPEDSPFPELRFSKPGTESRWLYRLESDGRPVFISASDSVGLQTPGLYFLGTDVESPVLTVVSERIREDDSTEVVVSLQDNVTNLFLDWARSDAPQSGWSRQSVLAPGTLAFVLKNPGDTLKALTMRLGLSDGAHTVNLPQALEKTWRLPQRMRAPHSPATFSMGQNKRYLWDLVSLPFTTASPVTLGALKARNPGLSLRGAEFGRFYLQDDYVLKPGTAVWLSTTKPTPSLALPDLDILPEDSASLEIPLERGWNYIGAKTLQRVYWPVSRLDSAEYRRQSLKAPWCFDPDSVAYVHSDSLNPWHGCIVYSFQSGTTLARVTFEPLALTKSGPGSAVAALTKDGAAWRSEALNLTLTGEGLPPLQLGADPRSREGFWIEDEPMAPAFDAPAPWRAEREGIDLQADWIPFRRDSLMNWTVVIAGSATGFRALGLAAGSWPEDMEAYLLSPSRKLKAQLRVGETAAWGSAAGGDTMLVVAGTRELLKRNGFLTAYRNAPPAFDLSFRTRPGDFTLALDLPVDADFHVQVIDLRGRVLGDLQPSAVGAGRHAYSFSADFRKRIHRLPTGICFLRVQLRGKDLPSVMVRRLPIP